MANHLTKAPEPEELPEDVTMRIECGECEELFVIKMPRTAYDLWQKGALIQNALPMLTDNERELLKTSTCGSCFDDICDEGGVQWTAFDVDEALAYIANEN